MNNWWTDADHEAFTKGTRMDLVKTKKTAENAYKYGYYGSDQTEAAVYRYIAEELSRENDDPGEIHIPTVKIAAIEPAGNEALVYGTFLIENFRIVDSDILECISSAFYPGVMRIDKNGNVTEFERLVNCDVVGIEAKNMFGRHFDSYVKVCNDDEVIPDERLATISEYVRRNGLKVTKYQDEGWDPEPLDV